MLAIRIIHRAFSGLFALLGLLLILFFATMAFRSVPDVTEVDFGWDEIGGELIDATEPAEYRELDYLTANDPALLDSFAGDNGFVASTGLQMLIGLFGLGLMYSALAQRPTGRWVGLHLGGLAGVVMIGFYGFGFNFAYPGSFALNGLVAAGIPGPFIPMQDDHVFDYGMAFTIWTDFFYQSLYAILAAALVLSLAAGYFRGPTVMLVAVAVGVFAFPLTTSWLWGGGWLSDLGAADFAGSAMVHVLAGGAAFALVVLGRVCPAAGPGFSPGPGAIFLGSTAPRMNLPAAALFCTGAIFLFCLVVGMNAGSVLASDVPVVAAVLNATLCAVIGGVVTSALISIGLARRPRLQVAVVGGLTAWAAICAPADSVTSIQAFGIGAIAAALGTCCLWVVDRFGFDDPFGVVAVSLVGGSFGMVVAGGLSADLSVLVQIAAVGSIASVGFGLGATLGLFAWLAKVLRDPPEMMAATPD